MEKYGRARQTTDNNVMWRMRITLWITKAADTRSEYAIRMAFPGKQWLHGKPLSVTFIRASPGLLFFEFLLLSLRFGRFRFKFKF